MMNYQRGINRLLERLDDDEINEATPTIAALRTNLRKEQLYGSNEAIRSKTAELVSDLNRIALDELGVSFNDLCLMEGIEQKRGVGL